MLGPTTCAVVKRGSWTVNAAASRIAASARSRRVISQPSIAGSHETGSRSRSARQQRVRIALELLDGRRRAEREALRPHARPA